MRRLYAVLSIIMLLFTIPERDGRHGEKEKNMGGKAYNIECLDEYRDGGTVNQLLLVEHTNGSRAVARFYVRNEDVYNKWELIFECTAYIGKNGIGKTKEGDQKTPEGDFGIGSAFGIKENPGTQLEYINVTGTTYACDEDCEYYNQIIDTSVTGHKCAGEKMASIAPQYNYGLEIGYNTENVYPLGSAIFLHCMGKNPYTAGCVAIPEENMKTVLLYAQDGMRVIIYEG